MLRPEPARLPAARAGLHHLAHAPRAGACADRLRLGRPHRPGDGPADAQPDRRTWIRSARSILVITYFGGVVPVRLGQAGDGRSAQPAHLAAGRHGARRRRRACDQLPAGAVCGRRLGAHASSRATRSRSSPTSIVVNVILGVFNLLPIPPLDGSRVIGGFMPRDVYAQLGRARPVRDVRGLRAVHPLQRPDLDAARSALRERCCA